MSTGRTGLPGTLGTGAADGCRVHGFGGPPLLGTDVLERHRHLALLALLDVRESGGGELAADLLLSYDGGGQGRVLMAGWGDRAVSGESPAIVGGRALLCLHRPSQNDPLRGRVLGGRRSRARSSASTKGLFPGRGPAGTVGLHSARTVPV